MCTGMLLSFVSTVYYFQRLSSTDFPVKKSLSGKTTVTTCPKYIGYVLLSLAMYCISMFSSSYIEEEHNFWYYFLQTSWIILVIERYTAPICLHSPPGTNAFRRFQESRSAQNSNLQWIGTALLQMVLFRVIQNWNSTGDQHAGDIDVRYYLTTTYRNLSWHLLAATLIFNCIQCVRNLRQMQISTSRTKDISQAARLIYGASKLVYLACVMLTSVLVVIYKVRSESSRESVPSLYQDLTTWELADRLNQVQLGRLIFNYGAASLFMLNVCIFIGKFVRKLDITDKRIGTSSPYLTIFETDN
jgi:ethanolaminephosphotransferase